jgi:calpain, invertebrate
MMDDAKKLVCAIAMKTPAEAEAILGILRQEPPARIDPQFYTIAQNAVTTGLARRRRDHLLLCTKNMITYLSEYVQDGLQRLDLLWDKSLLERYKPLAFTGVGEGAAYRVDASDAGMVSRVSVLVPVLFTAQGTCVFDRSREAPSQVSGVGLEPGELRLGRLADAYLFGAMSILSTSPTALAQTFPLLDQDLVQPDRVEVATPFPTEQQYNDEGVYAVRFWRGNRSRVVVVDDFIPCSQYGKPVFASFTGSNGKFEIWSLLIEKAYAKLHGGYETIIGGQEAYALQDLFGGVPVTYKLQETCPTEDQAWQTLSSTLASGSLVGCINDSVDMELPRGLQKAAAYGILKLVEIDYRGELVRLVQLRNSWGVGSVSQPDKWVGSWSSADPKWHSLSRQQKVEIGFQFREDATYWLDFSAFYCFFSSIIESRNLYNFRSIPDGLGNPVSPTLSVHIVTSEWHGITSGGRAAMHLNPQYHVFSPATSQVCALTVHLEQPSRRLQNASEYGAYIAPVVFRHGTRSQRKIDLAAGDVVATGTFISNRSCVLETPLEHTTGDPSRPFVVIPATYDGNLPNALSFSLTMFTSLPTAIVPVSDSSSLPICCVCQRALSGAFRTFTLAGGEGDAPSQIDRVCNDCVRVYRDRNTPVCHHCQERIEMVEGRFSGRLFTLPDGVSVHAECVDAYRIRLADKCVHCGQAIAAIPGRFDGRFFEIAGGQKCHAECMDAYQLATATRCMHCTEPVAKIAGRFDGRFYKLASDQELVHFECWDAYQASIAPKCVHCTQPIVVVPGRFDGRFYELTSGVGKVHFECWEIYQAAVLKR